MRNLKQLKQYEVRIYDAYEDSSSLDFYDIEGLKKELRRLSKFGWENYKQKGGLCIHMRNFFIDDDLNIARSDSCLMHLFANRENSAYISDFIGLKEPLLEIVRKCFGDITKIDYYGDDGKEHFSQEQAQEEDDCFKSKKQARRR